MREREERGYSVLKKTMVAVFFLVLVLSTQSSHAVIPPPEQYDITEDADPSEKLDFEKRLEERLAKDIESYLGHRRFFLKINAEQSKIKTILRRPFLVPPDPSLQPNPEPVKTFDNTELSDRETEKSENTTLLPGMPVGVYPKKSIPRAMRQPESRQGSPRHTTAREPVYEYKEEVFTMKTVVKKIAISFVVDQGITGQQEEFIKNLVFNKAQLDTLRGDVFQITKTDFPQPTAAPLNPYAAYVPYVVILLFGFLLVILLVVVIGQRRTTQKIQIAAAPVATPPVPEKIVEPASAPAPDADDGKISHLRQEIVSMGLGHPDLIKRRVREEMDNGGVEKVSLIYKGIGFNLAKSLFTSLTEREQADVKKYLSDNKDIDAEALAAVMDEFYHGLVYDSLLHSSKKMPIKPFGFLDELDDSQIKYILENEEVRIKALILSQLTPIRTASIIKTFPLDTSGQIAAALGEFESIPINVYQDVADRLSKKAIGVPSFANISADGIGLLVNMFDNLDGAAEKALLDILRTQNPSVYHKLKQVYFTFWDIPRVPKDKLKDILREIDRATMALALVDVEAEFKTYVLESLSEKMRIMVEDEMETIGTSFVQKNVDDARLAMTRKIRMQIHKEGTALLA